MTVLVMSATGSMGSRVVHELLARGATVRALVRDERRAAHLAAAVQGSVGDLRDPNSVARALEGVRSAFYISPHEPDEVELARTFVKASEARGTRLVMAGTHFPDPDARARLANAFPAYRGKLQVSEMVAASVMNP